MLLSCSRPGPDQDQSYFCIVKPGAAVKTTVPGELKDQRCARIADKSGRTRRKKDSTITFIIDEDNTAVF
jgi:hypothetical protein